MFYKPKLPKVSAAWINVKNNWLIRIINRGVFGLTISSFISIALFWHSLPPAVPLWYSRPWGADQLVSPLALLILPISTVLVYCINIAFVVFVVSEHLVFAQMIFLASFLVSFISTFALLRILFLIT